MEVSIIAYSNLYMRQSKIMSNIHTGNKTYLLYFYADVVVRFFLCFSLIQNTSRIMNTNVPANAITAINGMRVLSMWWVILGHTYAFQQATPLSKYLQTLLTGLCNRARLYVTKLILSIAVITRVALFTS